MKYLTNWIYLIAVLILSYSCQSAEERQQETTSPQEATNAAVQAENEKDAQKSLKERLGEIKSLSYFLAFSEQIGIDNLLENGDSSLTIFVPERKSWDPEQLEALSTDENKLAELKQIIPRHMAYGNFTSTMLSQDIKELSMLDGSKVPVRFEGSTIFIGSSKISIADLEAQKGRIHVINAPLQ
ncbi:MAG: fasciclin domain-containing protein [Bernardetiaceae bacterium]|nr:fasciclin domain-containing protein [Bernardetiaceae bacterium]